MCAAMRAAIEAGRAEAEDFLTDRNDPPPQERNLF
jgi:hypothetical protein